MREMARASRSRRASRRAVGARKTLIATMRASRVSRAR